MRRASKLFQLDSGRVAILTLVLILTASLARFPAQIIRSLLPALPVMRLWASPDEQYRQISSPAPYDLLQVADATLPRDTSVLLVTSGEDVKRAEYITYHRSLFFLTPRTVWWLSAAQKDGTWESRKWISAPLTLESVQSVAAEYDVDYLLTYALDDAPLDLGRVIFSNADGQLIQLDLTLPLLEPQQTGSSSVGSFWPLQSMAAIAVVIGIGFFFLSRIARLGFSARAIERLSLSWVLGAGFLSLAMFWLSLLGVKLAGQIILLALAALLGLYLSRRQPVVGVTPGDVLSRYDDFFKSPAEMLLSAIIACQITFVALMAVGRPLSVWDSWATWGLKARTIFLEGSISPAVYTGASRASTLPQYPLMFPSVQAWVYGWLGAPDDRLAGMVSLLFYVALAGIVCAVVLRRSSRPRLAMLACAVVASIPYTALLAGFVYADVPFAALLVVIGVYSMEWLERGSPGSLAISALAAGFAPWCKQEGVVFLVSAIGAVYVFESMKNHRLYPPRAAWIWIGSCLAAVLVLAGPWWFLINQRGYVTRIFLPATPQTFIDHLDRVSRIAGMLIKTLAGSDFAFIWPLVLIFGVYMLGKSRLGLALQNRKNILMLSALFYLAFTAGSYLFSDYAPLQSHISSSFYRLAMHVTPIAVIWLAFSASQVTVPEALLEEPASRNSHRKL